MGQLLVAPVVDGQSMYGGTFTVPPSKGNYVRTFRLHSPAFVSTFFLSGWIVRPLAAAADLKSSTINGILSIENGRNKGQLKSNAGNRPSAEVLEELNIFTESAFVCLNIVIFRH